MRFLSFILLPALALSDFPVITCDFVKTNLLISDLWAGLKAESDIGPAIKSLASIEDGAGYVLGIYLDTCRDSSVDQASKKVMHLFAKLYTLALFLYARALRLPTEREDVKAALPYLSKAYALAIQDLISQHEGPVNLENFYTFMIALSENIDELITSLDELGPEAVSCDIPQSTGSGTQLIEMLKESAKMVFETVDRNDAAGPVFRTLSKPLGIQGTVRPTDHKIILKH